MQVLMIDNDSGLCDLIREVFVQSGVSLIAANTAEVGLRRLREDNWEVVILDAILPDVSGFDILQRVRLISDIVIIMLTDKDDDYSKIKGLNLGADDCLSKPFSADELLARMRAILRRTNRPQLNNAITIDDVVYYPSRNQAEVSGTLIALTGVESVILKILISRVGEPVSRGHFYRTVLNRDVMPSDRSLDTHISSLRKKLGPTKKGSSRILSVRGVGYQYVS